MQPEAHTHTHTPAHKLTYLLQVSNLLTQSRDFRSQAVVGSSKLSHFSLQQHSGVDVNLQNPFLKADRGRRRMRNKSHDARLSWVDLGGAGAR